MDEVLREWMPHGHCFAWAAGVFWPMLAGNLGIALAYFAIPSAMLWHWSRHRGESRIILPWVFAAFVTCCGVGHVLKLLVLWWGYYGLAAVWDCVTAVVSLWAAWRVAQVLLLTRESEVSAAVEMVVEARRAGALDPATLDRLDALAREHDEKASAIAANYESLDLVCSNLPNVAVILGVHDALGRPVVEYAGGEVLTHAGFDPQEMRGVLVADLPGTDPRLPEFYTRAIEGERLRRLLSEMYETDFVPVRRGDGTPLVLVFARDVTAEEGGCGE